MTPDSRQKSRNKTFNFMKIARGISSDLFCGLQALHLCALHSYDLSRADGINDAGVNVRRWMWQVRAGPAAPLAARRAAW